MSAYIVSESTIVAICHHLINVQKEILTKWVDQVKLVDSVKVEYEKPLHEKVLALDINASNIEKAKVLAEVLATSNFQSVNYRYNENESPDTYIKLVLECLDGDTSKVELREIDDTQFLKLTRCLNYQSCERDDWDYTIAKLALDLVWDKLGSLERTSAYDSAEWGF